MLATESNCKCNQCINETIWSPKKVKHERNSTINGQNALLDEVALI